MPGSMNGSQLAVEAQRLRPGIKVLLTSGYVANIDEGKVIGRGELPVLSKPYRRDELARSLRLCSAAKDAEGVASVDPAPEFRALSQFPSNYFGKNYYLFRKIAK